MAVWTSVEYVEVALAAGDTTATENLSNSQDETQCTPFAGRFWVGTVAASSDQWRAYGTRIEMIDNAGTPAVRVTRPQHTGTGNTAVTVGVFVVEWDASINVQQVSHTMATADAADTVTITDVGAQDSAFFFYSYAMNTNGNSGDDYDDWCVRASFNGASTTQINLDRQNTDGELIGTLYVVDCDSSEWTVQHEDITISASTANSSTGTITAVTTADSFIVHSFETDESVDDAADGLWHAHLTNTTTVTVQRGDDSPASSNSNTSVHTVQVVECNNNQWDVQRGEETMGTASESVSITAIDQDRSFAKIGGYFGSSLTAGRNDSTTGSDVPASAAILDFSANDTLRIRKNGTVLTTDVVPWEVIQFAAAGSDIVIPVATGPWR